MKKGKIYLLVCLVSILFITKATAQTDTVNAPQWVKMMDDPNANYFEAIKSFKNFWKNKEKPIEEKEVFENFEKKKEKKVRSAKGADAVKYSFEYKKFLNWQIKTRPFVQPDGRILTTQERLQLFEKEKKMRQNDTIPSGN